MMMSMVSGIPRKHARSLQRLHSLAFNFRTFTFAKDQASSFLDGLLRKTRHNALIISMGSLGNCDELSDVPAHRSAVLWHAGVAISIIHDRCF